MGLQNKLLQNQHLEAQSSSNHLILVLTIMKIATLFALAGLAAHQVSGAPFTDGPLSFFTGEPPMMINEPSFFTGEPPMMEEETSFFTGEPPMMEEEETSFFTLEPPMMEEEPSFTGEPPMMERELETL